MVTKFDHPDFVGGIVWSDCELRWINEKLAAAQAREAELIAHVERLRDALQMPCDRWSKHQHKIVKEALESTPAQSLARLRNEVLEEAAKVCDRFAEREMHPAECAAALRAMKEPEREQP